MSKYRCPVCGSPHREPVEVCRQCGQAMASDIKPQIRQSDASVRARYTRKSVWPYVLFGCVLVGLLLILGVALGLANTEGPVGEALNKVPIIGNHDDGWEVFDEPSGVWRAELPSEPTEQKVVDVSTEGTTTTWVSPIADRMDLAVAYTSGARLDPAGDTYEQLKPLADSYVTQLGGAFAEEPVVTTFEGYPAMAFAVDEISIYGERAYLYGLIIQVDDEAVVATTTSVEPDPDQHQRLLDNLEILIGNPSPTTTEPSP
jgi:hypothetical protein